MVEDNWTWFFSYFVLAGTDHPVCDECAAKHAPDLVHLRRIAFRIWTENGDHTFDDAFEMAKIEIDAIKEESSYASEAFLGGGKSALQTEIKVGCRRAD